MVCTTMSAAAGGLGVASASLILFQHVGPDQVINGVRLTGREEYFTRERDKGGRGGGGSERRGRQRGEGKYGKFVVSFSLRFL